MSYIGRDRWYDRFKAAWRVLTAKELYFIADNQFEDFPENRPLIHFENPAPNNTVVVFADNTISYKGEKPCPTS